MQTIDMKEVLKSTLVSSDDIADQLFPGAKYPRLAFNRIVAGKGVLDANQVSKLAAITGMSITDLYNAGSWELTSDKKEELIFRRGEYTAILDLKNWKTTILSNNTLMHQNVIHAPSITLSEYLNHLDNILNTEK